MDRFSVTHTVKAKAVLELIHIARYISMRHTVVWNIFLLPVPANYSCALKREMWGNASILSRECNSSALRYSTGERVWTGLWSSLNRGARIMLEYTVQNAGAVRVSGLGRQFLLRSELKIPLLRLKK